MICLIFNFVESQFGGYNNKLLVASLFVYRVEKPWRPKSPAGFAGDSLRQVKEISTRESQEVNKKADKQHTYAISLVSKFVILIASLALICIL